MTRHLTTLKHCPPTGCNDMCNQGRECLDALNASRAIVGLRLIEGDGGHRVSGSDSLRLRIERAAEPEPTSRWPDAIVAAVIVLACILAAACMGVQIHF